MTIADLLALLITLVSAVGDCMSPFIAPVVGLVGVYLGLRHERGRSVEESKRRRAEQALEDRVAPIQQWVHHVSVVATYQTHVAEVGVDGLAELHVKDDYLDAIALATRLEGPASVQIHSLKDSSLTRRFGRADKALNRAIYAIQQDKSAKEVQKLSEACITALADIELRLEQIKKAYVNRL